MAENPILLDSCYFLLLFSYNYASHECITTTTSRLSTNARVVSYPSIRICTIRPIQPTKLDKMTKTQFFGTSFRIIMLFLHKLWHFSAPWMLLELEYCIYLTEYAISDQLNQQNSMHWPKTSFLALRRINYANFAN